jgi:hypothetical protein
MTFKDEHRPLQELARELDLLRRHNLQFKAGDPQHHLLLMAEAALTCLTMEHFVRIVVGDKAPAGATLHNLLEVAVARGLLRVPWDDQQDGIRKICAVRNTLLHANYAQAAREAKCESVEAYFKGPFASEIERTFEITDYLMKQIDTETGQPRAAAG